MHTQMSVRASAGSAASAVPRGPVPQLRPGELRILAYASTIGSEFPFDLLHDAMGVDEETLAEELEDLVRKGLLTERSGGGSFAFVEEGVRASVYRSMTESRHRLLHRKIAEVLERRNPDPSSEVIAALGRHYFLGKVPAKSYLYNRRAASNASASEDPSSAVHYLERALLDLGALEGASRRERAEVAQELGDLCYAVGRYGTADRYYAAALDYLDRDTPNLRARLLLARAEVARENLAVAQARTGAADALRLFEGNQDAVGIARAHRLLGRLDFQEGRYRDSLEECMRALDVLPPGANPRALGRLSTEIGNAFALLGEETRPVAIEWYERAVDRLRASRDWVELARALHNLGTIVGETRPADGLELLERAREAADRGHDSRGIGRCLLSGVELRLALGQLDEAARDNAQAGRLLERLADPLGVDLVLKNAGRISERRGQWDDAARSYGSSIELAQRYHLTAEEAEAQYCLANLKYKTRDFEGARAALDRAVVLGVEELAPRLASAVTSLRRQLRAGAETSGVAPRTKDPTDSSLPAQDRPFA